MFLSKPLPRLCFSFLLLAAALGLFTWLSWVKQPQVQANQPLPSVQIIETGYYKAYVQSLPPLAGWQVLPQVAGLPKTVAGFRPIYPQARVIINAGYFDPANGLSASWVQTAGPQAVLLDPNQNPRLTENLALKPYWPAIINRSELRILLCVENKSIGYQIALHTEDLPEGCQLKAFLGAGPRLLPTLQAIEEGFVAKNAQGRVIRDAIGVYSRSARTAVALKADGTLLLVLIEQPAGLKGQGGMSLPELAEFLKTQGATEALNLDGGSSSSAFFNNRATVYARKNSQGQSVKRAVLSVLAVEPSP